MQHRFVALPIALVVITCGLGAVSADESYPIATRRFQQYDKDKDGKVSLKEFVAIGPVNRQKVRERDFRLADMNGDGVMILDEYRILPGIPFEERGRIPDPIADLVEEQMLYFQLHAPEWDANQNGTLELDELTSDKCWNEFSHQFRYYGTEISARQNSESVRRRITWISRDRNREISREEIRFGLEVSFGVRTLKGEPVRTQSGTVYNLLSFRGVDQNRNNVVEFAEFQQRGWGKDKTLTFLEVDTDANGRVDFTEWCAHPTRRLDSVNAFLRRDTNLDGRLDGKEYLSNGPPSLRAHADRTLKAFDMDSDGFLSFEEFRATPLLNPVYSWLGVLRDKDLDKQLSRAEFEWDTQRTRDPQMIGLANWYFSRFDLDDNGTLDHDEFYFVTPVPTYSRLFRIDRDGTNLELLTDVPLLDMTIHGSPDYSPNGKALAFDGFPHKGADSDMFRSQVMTMPLEGPDVGKPQRIGWGNCPRWSPDGKTLAFFVYSNPDGEKYGTWLCDADGSNRRQLAERLIMPQWSTDGKNVLCVSEFYGPHQLVLIDVVSGQQTKILENATVLGVPTWHPTALRIAITLKVDDRRVLGVVDLYGDADSLVELWSAKLDPNQQGRFYENTRPHWSSDGKSIVFADSTTKPISLKRVNVTGEDEPVVIHDDFAGEDPVWSHDGKQIVFRSSQKPEEIPKLKRFAVRTDEPKSGSTTQPDQ